jgi:LPXTG-motif cell wall-anchored protein
MNTKWKSSTLVLALVLVLSAPAFARHKDPPAPPGNSGTAPEVDPSLAIAGISFLGGSLVVLRSRRRK